MPETKEILGRVEEALLFASREDCRHLGSVSGLEKMVLKQMEILSLSGHDTGGGWKKAIIRIRKAVTGFDSLSGAGKAAAVMEAVALIGELKRLCGKTGGDHVCAQAPAPAGAKASATVRDPVSVPATDLNGVGSRTAELLRRKGVETVRDVLFFLPIRYEDRRILKTVAEAEPGRRETVLGSIASAGIRWYGRRKVFEAVIEDQSGGIVTAKWFQGRAAYLQKLLSPGAKIILTGEIKGNRLLKETLHPDFEILDGDENDLLHFRRIVPVYSATEGLHQKWMRRIAKQAVEKYADLVPSPIPDHVCRRHRLPSMGESIRRVHFPGDEEDFSSVSGMKTDAFRRLAFDELFFFELAMALRKSGNAGEKGTAFAPQRELIGRFRRVLDFPLTAAQDKAMAEIFEDMALPRPMNRLLQGDVGCGKTVVAMAAVLTACGNGFQAAVMAPTEILAEQHFSQIRRWAEALDLPSVLLTGSMPAGSRKESLEKIEAGAAAVIVGTHSLIQETVSFRRLGLAVIDEQHRFGVVQRGHLREKAISPDMLFMTATPIPRTLALTAYGDLDISVIDELPPSRIPVSTKIAREKDRGRVYEAVKREVEKGNRVFIVYPLVEESDALDLKDATGMADNLREKVFPRFRVGLVHGKMRAEARQKEIEAFRCGKTDILVATTVVEVGVDVPEASLMIIEHADRFGLSQLHQLRGRVGRSGLPATCILMTGCTPSEIAARRLRKMEETNDGFRIAEEDLAIRGPGQFMGTRQSGFPDFRIACIFRDYALLDAARREAFMIIGEDPLLEKAGHRRLRDALFLRWGDRLRHLDAG
ncbi:MAG TPA: ATP-dependent DNA helicase RecG [Syntrophales bacterium]|nr:ATP-dependent DNA helicase RecG [Syntrophales bacterium]